MKTKTSENAGVHRGVRLFKPALPDELRLGSDSDRQFKDRGIPSEWRFECVRIQEKSFFLNHNIKISQYKLLTCAFFDFWRIHPGGGFKKTKYYGFSSD
jgi:hypothetical protein